MLEKTGQNSLSNADQQCEGLDLRKQGHRQAELAFSDGTSYSIEEMDGIYQTLLLAARVDVTKEEHIESIRRTQADIQNRICPRCGSALVLREGKYGRFYGCSNYPKCNFTAKP